MRSWPSGFLGVLVEGACEDPPVREEEGHVGQRLERRVCGPRVEKGVPAPPAAPARVAMTYGFLGSVLRSPAWTST